MFQPSTAICQTTHDMAPEEWEIYKDGILFLRVNAAPHHARAVVEGLRRHSDAVFSMCREAE